MLCQFIHKQSYRTISYLTNIQIFQNCVRSSENTGNTIFSVEHIVDMN